MHAFPSVPPVTTTPLPAPTPAPARSMNTTASTLSSSLCPSSAPTTSPLLKLTTLIPPETPPTTARVDEELTAREVIPSSANRASDGESLNMGVGDRGSQKMSVPSPSAVIIRFPVGKIEFWLAYSQIVRWYVGRKGVVPSGVNSPHWTGPVCPAKTCMVFPDGTE